MGGGGKRRPSNRNVNNNNNTTNNNNSGNRNRSNSGGKSRGGVSASARIRNTLFVEGGVLSDWSPGSSHPPGRNVNKNAKSALRNGNDNQKKAPSANKNAPRKSIGNTFGYTYPTVEPQENFHPGFSAVPNNGEKTSDELQPLVLVDSKEESLVVAYSDESSALQPRKVDFTYEYGSSFVLGDSSHRGLGFNDEYEANPSGIASSSKQMEEEGEEGFYFSSSSSDEEMDADESISREVGERIMDDAYPAKTNLGSFSAKRNSGSYSAKRNSGSYSAKRNSGFVSIGGVKLFTEDISDEETDGNDDGESLDDHSSGSSESEPSDEQSDSDVSGDTSSSDLEIDEEVAEDYLEGIGGSMKILDAKWLRKRDLGDSEDTSSSSSIDETVEKLGGIALQEASMEYGMDPKARKKSLDDFMFVKDPRTLYPRKKHVSRLPRSWPSEAQRSKGSRRFPGMKKKHRKEGIAQKRRERMRRRGVVLEKINMILEEIVLDGTDLFHFDPMHSRDCAQVRRLASIYRLHSGCRSCGKLSFVTVTRTKDTCMPSAADKVRLQKLIGAANEDSDFAVVERSNSKSANADRSKKKNTMRGSGGKRASFAKQPVSFVSSGLMESETAETHVVEDKEANGTDEGKDPSSSGKVGAFEEHTRGFGSKMMAKMGFVEGGGLGKDGQGMAAPIEVVQRPKSLGLGVDFSNVSPNGDSVKSKPESSKPSGKHANSQSFGAFEKHTKGFGSKMMAKMGFVEGTGLGRDSQGITNPLVAVRRPKARGLGAKV
ncbi:hypothetical protein Tsubulata_014115 [Turnera subulata]|uniref:G-patch domain-containing protein n=1 Tax=Turnera subulata TaxID=218843 RepID=A0A9Q0GAU2_9ROSI|nr:hypothetical protein Tsubulata_014115 [Turnera subulata]